MQTCGENICDKVKLNSQEEKQTEQFYYVTLLALVQLPAFLNIIHYKYKHLNTSKVLHTQTRSNLEKEVLIKKK